MTDDLIKKFQQAGINIKNITNSNITIIFGNNNNSVQEVFQANGVPLNNTNKQLIKTQIVKKAKQIPAKKVPAKKVPAKKKAPNTP